MYRRLSLLFLLLIVVVTATTAVTAQETVQPVQVVVAKLDNTPRVAVLSAFDNELQLLLGEANITNVYVVGGRSYHVGSLAGNEVVMALTGVSIPNASVATNDVIQFFNVTHIVYSGIAGGVNPALNIGDVTVPTQWGLYLEAYFARETKPGEFSPPSWWTPEFKNFGMIYPSSTSVIMADAEPDAYTEAFWYPVDADMLAVAKKVAASISLEDCNSDKVCLQHQPRVVVGGNGVSGMAFVDNAAFRTYVFDTFQAQALDMETAATGKEAYQAGVPYLAFRSLSDLAGGGPGENEIGTFFQVAADNSAHVVMAFLEAWANR